MSNLRRVYYNGFSTFYDRFIDFHSRDKQGLARRFLADQLPVGEGASVLDLCTGTATLLSQLQAKVGPDGRVVGVDFSRGMLKVSRDKMKSFINIHLVEADAGHLPFVTSTFDAVTCSHAFYELKGQTQDEALREIVRVLRPKGAFLMMEHDVPMNLFVRALFYLRLASMGAGRAVSILRHEQELLRRYFGRVEKVVVPAGRSKILICRK
jgi:demethylmenaquinone methyltransferase/2-methoxy-6-polyprenyl-1,4-benzoquinol methylase